MSAWLWIGWSRAVGSGWWPVALAALVSLGLLWRRQQSRSLIRRRLLGPGRNSVGSGPAENEPGASPALLPAAPRERLDLWLTRAGLEVPGARRRFGAGLLAAGLSAGFLLLALHQSGLLERAAVLLEAAPPGLAEAAGALLELAPGLVLMLVLALPVLAVRQRRRRRVAELERDLPTALGLLATLVESGLGVDAAVERVRVALGPRRALSREFATFRAESQAGVVRSVCYRRLGARADVPAVSLFTSAMIHAEQLGSSIAETLRALARDVWSQRREEAIRRAQLLPTKLAFPLVLCFLPGVFVWTFGPAVAEFLRLTDLGGFR